MDLTTKCRDCLNDEDCRVKISLNEVVQKIIKQTEQFVRKEASLNIEYIIVTDVTVIPTNCEYFVPKEKAVIKTFRLPRFARESYVTV